MKQYIRFKFSFGVVLAFALCWIVSASSWGAPCCSRNSATPALIVGDDDALINFGVALGSVVAEVSDEGYPNFGSADSSELNQIFRWDGALRVSDRFQVAATVPFVRHVISTPGVADSSTGIGDLRLSAAYDALPVWDYSSWIPEGYVFAVATLPTGTSKYDSVKPTSSDVTGNGFFALSVGSIFFKRWVLWDVFLMPEIHYSIPNSFMSFGQKVQVVPGLGGSVGFGAGISPGGGAFRLGLRIQPRLDQGLTVRRENSLIAEESSMIAATDTALDLSYLLSTNNTLMVSYTDQTLLGPAMNGNLSRILALNFQHRWEK